MCREISEYVRKVKEQYSLFVTFPWLIGWLRGNHEPILPHQYTNVPHYWCPRFVFTMVSGPLVRRGVVW
jgi:hypothetical protein